MLCGRSCRVDAYAPEDLAKKSQVMSNKNKETPAGWEVGQLVGSWQQAWPYQLNNALHRVGQRQRWSKKSWPAEQESLYFFTKKENSLCQIYENQFNILCDSYGFRQSLKHPDFWDSPLPNDVFGKTINRFSSTVARTTTMPHVNITSFHHTRGSFKLFIKSKIMCIDTKETNDIRFTL